MITNAELDKIFLMISRNVKYYRIHNQSKYADKFGRISQEKLAELCDVSQSLIANIESEKVKQTFSITVIASISKVLNIPFEEFFKEHNFTKKKISFADIFFILYNFYFFNKKFSYNNH